jgi:hypothetical protein
MYIVFIYCSSDDDSDRSRNVSCCFGLNKQIKKAVQIVAIHQPQLINSGRELTYINLHDFYQQK